MPEARKYFILINSEKGFINPILKIRNMTFLFCLLRLTGTILTIKLDKTRENIFQLPNRRQHRTKRRDIHKVSPMITIALCLGPTTQLGLSGLGPKESMEVLLSCRANTRVGGSWSGWKNKLQNGNGNGLPCFPKALTEGWVTHTGKAA